MEDLHAAGSPCHSWNTTFFVAAVFRSKTETAANDFFLQALENNLNTSVYTIT